MKNLLRNAFAALFVLACPAAFAGTGTLDGSFGFGGKVMTDFGGSFDYDYIRAIALQPDGKIVAVGTSQDRYAAIARYLPDGRLDPAFGSGGKVVLQCAGCMTDPRGVAVRPDGRIVVAGTINPYNNNAIVVARLDASGALDPTFGSGGISQTLARGTTNAANAMVLQPDGKILVAGTSGDHVLLARFLADGGLDTSFNGTGLGATMPITRGQAGAMAVGSDGRIVLAGSNNNGDILVVGYNSAGSLYNARTIDFDAAFNGAQSVAVQEDGRILIGTTISGQSLVGPSAELIRLLPSFDLDTSFASAGRLRLNFFGAVKGIVPQADGRIVATTDSHLLFRLNADGSFDATFGDNGRYLIGVAASSATIALLRQPDGRYLMGGFAAPKGLSQPPGNDFLVMRVDTEALPFASANAIDFLWQSENTTSPAHTVVIRNTSAGSISVGPISVTAEFAQTNDCSTLAPGATCTVRVFFTPAVKAVPLNRATPVYGTLRVESSAAALNADVYLAGNAEKSLITHFYQALLGRAPDAPGKFFWGSEASRLVGELNVNVNEAWFAIAMSLYNSAEYNAAGRAPADLVRDFYRTFFNREADGAGLSYWTGQMAQGLPREVVLTAFMFSPEFREFTRAIFGNTAARAEVDMLMDFYRGLMGRLPDSNGFRDWLTRFRAAQCTGADAVKAQVASISGGFLGSAEYQSRARSSTQYVADLYNAFLRRGGDLDGVRYWIGQIDSGARSRDEVRMQFIASPEFQARVDAVIAQGCLR